MHEDAPPITSEHVRANALLAYTSMEYLLKEAAHHAHHDNQAGIQAVAMAIDEPVKLLSSVAQPLQGLYAQVDTPDMFVRPATNDDDVNVEDDDGDYDDGYDEED